MRFADIRRHLRPYLMVAKRRTTINHAFAAAIAPSDVYDEAMVREAILCLGQNPDTDLLCVYCGNSAETWDHVFATVRASAFSGYGHRVGNLLPCCKPCNSRKGNRTWEAYMAGLPATTDRDSREQKIRAYVAAYSSRDELVTHLPEYQRLQELRQQVLALLAEADGVASVLRKKAGAVQPAVQADGAVPPV
jgi:5-methylcytosine-specific restriction endonuclease McrA